MYPTIILFFALACTYLGLFNSANELNGSSKAGVAANIQMLLACILWSWLFYLLH